MGNAPSYTLPRLEPYKNVIDIWIGADGGALTLIENNIHVEHAIGDFDSINEAQKQFIMSKVKNIEEHSSKKDFTDLELAIMKAYEFHPNKIYLFGVTGGRLDHELINIQQLHLIEKKKIKGIIIDKLNHIELTTPNEYRVEANSYYPYISFIPLTPEVKGLTLKGFEYPLTKRNISFGSTLCISNKLLSNSGTYSYDEGILLLIKSRDTASHTIPK